MWYVPMGGSEVRRGYGVAIFKDHGDGERGTAAPRQHETHRTCPRPKDLDATSLRRLKFLRCFVRVNNLPRRSRPEELVGLFARFGPLRSWHVAFDDHGSGACSGFGYVVFRRRAHAKEAIDALNCCVFGGRKLRVDWAYPCA
ncbi:hypothetical protein ZWY2020_008945 [Hordeum vulgare]|nr:hypothetical protein ZWY2020_008945 [Hordeum vulgare]